MPMKTDIATHHWLKQVRYRSTTNKFIFPFSVRQNTAVQLLLPRRRVSVPGDPPLHVQTLCYQCLWKCHESGLTKCDCILVSPRDKLSARANRMDLTAAGPTCWVFGDYALRRHPFPSYEFPERKSMLPAVWRTSKCSPCRLFWKQSAKDSAVSGACLEK